MKEGEGLRWGDHRKARSGIFGPYLEWALATEFRYYGKAEWYPVVIDLEEATPSEFAVRITKDPRAQPLIQVSPCFLASPARIPKALGFCTAFVRNGFFRMLIEFPELGKFIKRIELSRRIVHPDERKGGGRKDRGGTGRRKDGAGKEPSGSEKGQPAKSKRSGRDGGSEKRSLASESGGSGLVEIDWSGGRRETLEYSKKGKGGYKLSGAQGKGKDGKEKDGTGKEGKGEGKEGSTGKPELVVLGIIDDGIAFAHERFRVWNGGLPWRTRVDYMWDQVEPSPADAPPGWNYGRHIDKAGINDLLNRCEHVGLVDEDEVYQNFHINFTEQGHKAAAWRISHGTLAMDLACGEDSASVGEDDPLKIVCVQLPVATTADTSGGSLTRQVIDALLYIIDRANTIGAEMKCGNPPIVVNLSYGIFAGPHDGSGELESQIQNIIEERQAEQNAPLRVVLPSGNSHLLRCHASVCMDDGQSRDLLWQVQPDDRTESFMQIWLPPSASQPSVSVEVITPSNLSSGAIVPGGSSPLTMNGRVVGEVANLAPDNQTNRGRILIWLAPTASDEPAPVVPCGQWRVVLTNTGGKTVHDIEAWIQRDDNPYGYPRRARQSCFEDSDYQRLNVQGRAIERDEDDDQAAYVKRDGSISAIATSPGSTSANPNANALAPIVLGGFRRSDGHPAKYSAGGPLLDPGRGAPSPDGPDAMAVSDESAACHGVMGAGSRSGSTIAMYGTSVAAPMVTRFVAGELLAGRLGDRQSVYDLADGLEPFPPPWSEPTPPAKRGGGGRIPFAPRAPRLQIRRVDE